MSTYDQHADEGPEMWEIPPAPVTPPPEELIARVNDLEIAIRLGKRITAMSASETLGDVLTFLMAAPPPAPSCPTEQGEVVEGLRAIHNYHQQFNRNGWAQTLTDAISLLSQPAVAQTEAGNDMTTSRPDVPSLEYIAASPLTRYGGFHPTTVQIAKDAIATIAALRAEVTRLSGKAADGDSAPVMSSTKSPSVPAVAGGGEDGELLDWLEKQENTLITGSKHGHYVYPDYFNDDRAVGYVVENTLRQAIRAAIAATKAKEESPWKPKLNS